MARMIVRMVLATAWVATLAAPVALVGQSAPVASRTAPPPALPPPEAIPLVAEHHYRLSGAARPLLLFWIGRDNVGGGRLTWRRAADGTLSLELLTGSDPARAPFGANRWGYLREVIRGDEAELVAVKSETEEETIEEAQASAGGRDRLLVFIRERVTADAATSWTTVADVGRDNVSFRDLDFVLRRMSELDLPEERVLERPAGVRPGFLAAFTELMQGGVDGLAGDSNVSTRTLTYIHRAKLYELTQERIEPKRDVELGGRRYARALEARFRNRNAVTGDSSRFDVLYGVDGDLAAVPLRITYRPRWWLRTELTLDPDADFSPAHNEAPPRPDQG